ncbi:hypothetical protein ACA910_021156 [Epithemia clementina (nom. ined.)]
MWNAFSTALFGGGTAPSTPKPKIPVTIITGFLGSGKSTLLNYILTSPDHGLKFAIIENELGAVSIDHQLLAAAASQHEHFSDEQIIQVTNGCICCSIRGDLVRALQNLLPKVLEYQLDGILLETTGLADPAPIVQTFFQSTTDNNTIASQFLLNGVVTVVDAKHILERFNEEKPPNVVNEAVEQIAFADVILLNKVDLIQEKENAETVLANIEEQIWDLNPTVQIVRTTHSRVPHVAQTLLQLQGFKVERALALDPDFLVRERKHRKDRTVSSVCCVVPGEVQLNLVQDWIRHLLAIPTASVNVPAPVGDQHGEGHDHSAHHHNHSDGGGHDHAHEHHHHDHNNANTTTAQVINNDLNDPNRLVLYRYKGILAVKGMDQKYVFQGVGMVFQGQFLPDLVWQEGEQRQSQFVFIGKHLNREELQSDFDACLVTDELRFALGAMVQVNVGGTWQLGTVVAHWDQGNPYRIQLLQPAIISTMPPTAPLPTEPAPTNDSHQDEIKESKVRSSSSDNNPDTTDSGGNPESSTEPTTEPPQQQQQMIADIWVPLDVDEFVRETSG